MVLRGFEPLTYCMPCSMIPFNKYLEMDVTRMISASRGETGADVAEPALPSR